MRPRDLAGKSRRQLAADQLAELVVVEKKIKTISKELTAMVLARGSRLMEAMGRLKRRISDAIHRQLIAAAQRAAGASP
ncbi:MAG: hypothetical protein M3Y66_06250 [Actinomycetota bacterium]|nr:hypothetical protein [Actinomycetota bacterium]